MNHYEVAFTNGWDRSTYSPPLILNITADGFYGDASVTFYAWDTTLEKATPIHFFSNVISVRKLDGETK